MTNVVGGEYRVYAIRYATKTFHRSEVFLGYERYGEPDAEIAMDYFFWVLLSDRGTVLVDTGFTPSVAERRGHDMLIDPLAALRSIGVEPSSVSHVVLTHLHYDHAGNVDAFPEAEIVLQSAEYEFWRAYGGRTQLSWLVEDSDLVAVENASTEGRLRLLHGDAQILPGVSVILVGGHTPGQQIVLVEGAHPIVFASDALHYYEELERDRPFDIVTNLEKMYEGYNTLRKLSDRPGTVLVAGHDPRVTSKFGAGDPGVTILEIV